jgi:hypothetical protein
MGFRLAAAYPGAMATLTLDIRSELPKAIRWTDAMTKQLPFAISQALNQSAFDVRTALGGATRQYFDRPNRFTQTAFLYSRSTKRNLEATVYANDQQGRDRARYLRFGIAGGTRPQKGFERKFLAEVVGTGRIPASSQLVPTSLVKLDGSGNVSLATIKRIQKGLNGNQRGGFFVGTPRGGNRPPGIYRRSREQLFPYFLATGQQARYRSRFPMQDIGQKVVQRRFGDYLRSSLERALESAR